MEALARAVAGLLHRAGWLVGLVVLEGLALGAFWVTAGVPYGGAFDRRAAEADVLLLILASLPAVMAGALQASGDREDGQADFWRSLGVSPERQVAGTALGLFAVTGSALAFAYLGALTLAAPAALTNPATWWCLLFALWFTGVNGLWGLALGSWFRSRWGALAAALAAWVLTVFVLEAVVQGLAAAAGPRWALSLVLGFTALDPAAFTRVASVAARGQLGAYGAAFFEAVTYWTSPKGGALVVVLLGLHLALPAGLAVVGQYRRIR